MIVGLVVLFLSLFLIFYAALNAANKPKGNSRYAVQPRENKTTPPKNQVADEVEMIEVDGDLIRNVEFAVHLPEKLYDDLTIDDRPTYILPKKIFEKSFAKYQRVEALFALQSKVACLNGQGEDLEKEGKIEEAIKVYEECIALRYNATRAYHRLMVLYRRLKRPEDEERVIRIAIGVYEVAEAAKIQELISQYPQYRANFLEVYEQTGTVTRDGKILFKSCDFLAMCKKRLKRFEAK